jgi:hypothetical protein
MPDTNFPTIEIFVDHREPPDLIDEIEFWANKLGVKVVIVRKALKVYDVLVKITLPDGIRKYGYEVKRIESDDYRQSKISGRFKKQIKNMYEAKRPFWVVFVGDFNNIPASDLYAVITIEAEIDCLGGRSTRKQDDSKFARYVVRHAEFISGIKEIRFRAFCSPVYSDDSLLTKVLKQMPGFGDKESEEIGSTHDNILQFLVDPIVRPEIIHFLNENVDKVSVSNYVREIKGKKVKKEARKKPLKRVVDLVDWFIGD